MAKKGSHLPLLTVTGCLAIGAVLVQASPMHRSSAALFSVEPPVSGTETAVARLPLSVPPAEIILPADVRPPLLASMPSWDVVDSFQRLLVPAVATAGPAPTPAQTALRRPGRPAVLGEAGAELQRASLPHHRSDSELEDRARQPIKHVVQVDKGDTLLDLLLRAGVERNEALNAIAALREVYNPRNLRVGQEITVTFERPAGGIGAGTFKGLSLQPDADREVTAHRHADGFAAKEVKHQVTRELARFSGTIRSNLFESAAAAGIPIATLVEMIRALSYDVDFQRDVQPGDTFEVMFERFNDRKGDSVRDGNILYAAMTLSGNRVAIFRYVDSRGVADYFDVNGGSVRKALLRTPVDGARLSSGFGARRHPILGYTKMHKGVDFAAPTGTPIYAAGDGVVEQAGTFGGYGNYVRIRHTNKYSTAYGHMSRFAQGIRTGKQIEQGQIIGYVGSTGASTGPHLHYEILVDGGNVNPLSVKFTGGNKLDPKELPRFQEAVKETRKTYANLPESSKLAAAESKTKAN